MEAIDETLLNDDNDDDLDYDLDPKEENALLQEETDLLEQEFEDEDILDINVDYEQMDVSDEKLDSISSDKARNEIRRDSNAGKKTTIPMYKKDKLNRAKNLSRINKRGFVNTLGNRVMRRSKTVLINPRFKGPVHVNGPFAWEKPTRILNQVPANQYIHPWSAGNIFNQTVQPPQNSVSNYSPAPFVPNSSFTYVQQPQQQILQPQPFIQPQVFVNPLPVMNQAPIMNHNMPPPQQPALQMDHYMNNYQVPSMPQMELIQQVPEAQKLPVHQRLGIPMDNFNQPLNNPIRYDNNQSLLNQMAFENHEYNNQLNQTNYSHPEQMPNMNQPRTNNNHYSNKKIDNSKYMNFNKKQHRKFSGNQNSNNNRVLLSPKKVNIMQNQKPPILQNSETRENKQCLRMENNSSSNIVVVPEDEDEETRQYRIKIEEQKRKREEVLRKKEENRLKNLSDLNTNVSTSTVEQKIKNHPKHIFKQKKFSYQHRPQQNQQFVKPQVNTNNIVITGNDDQCYFNSRLNKNIGNFNKGCESPSIRIVTAEPISCSNINSNIEHFDKDVDSKSLSSFLSNRVVSTQESLMQTNIVVVKNLATATTKPKIMKLCRGIGSVQKLQMETNERQATIHFDTVASAHKFYNKYRRYMIDLSMIQVDLLPPEGST
ncbi:homeobox protein 12-like isoform X2 [Coccinella septempunctata]|uniref:homeobox protein 12-like isoform X2 n=1 Tax=Coccinella septempunctata TaxID=41139 RepID=UPI001D072F6B|nr:homeobox protein 12-like isoform X2 [Coccinella septempunctata]